MPRPRTSPVRGMFGRGDGRASQLAVFAAARDGAGQPRVVQVTQPIGDRVGLHVRGDLVHEALVRERVLQPLGRPQRAR